MDKPNMDGMKNLGIKRGDMEDMSPMTPASEKEWKNQVCYICVEVHGKQAEMIGAAELEAGEYVKQTVIWKVAKKETEDDGEGKEYELKLEMVKGSDLEEVDKPSDVEDGAAEDDSEDEGEDEEMSPGLAYLTQHSD